MTVENLRNIILDFTQDVTFDYNGKQACINPWSMEKFEVRYGDEIKTFNNIDELFASKFFSGKSLAEIASDIKMTYL